MVGGFSKTSRVGKLCRVPLGRASPTLYNAYPDLALMTAQVGAITARLGHYLVFIEDLGG
jgi:hypothetical protein